MSHQVLDGAEIDLFVHEVCAERFPETRWAVEDRRMDKGIVGTEDGVYSIGFHSIAQPIAEEERPGQLFSHEPIVP